MADARLCAYCGIFEAAPRICPVAGEICGWCCVRCSASACSKGSRMDRYPAAETIARDLMLEPGDTIAAALDRWRVAYLARVGIEPEAEMVAAARAYLEQRLVGVLPPPASASGAWPRVPEMIRGVGKE